MLIHCKLLTLLIQDASRDAHEAALRKALDAYNTAAVGTGTSRAHYEKVLNNFCRKAFQVHCTPVIFVQDYVDPDFFCIFSKL